VGDLRVSRDSSVDHVPAGTGKPYSLFAGTCRWAYLTWVGVPLRYTRDGDEMNKKHLRYAAIAFVIFYLWTDPQAAADVVNNTISALGDAGDSLSQFVSNIGT
jgi:hypothetical protein